MNHTNKKPGALRRPGKVKTPRKHKRLIPPIHRKIAAEAALHRHFGRPWKPHEFPLLFGLVESALADFRHRRRLKGRMLFWHQGEQYAARLTSLDRLVIEDRQTGEALCSSQFFAL